jgi:Tol biopolymer transport system component
VWSPDSRRVAYASTREGVRQLFEKTVADGSAAESIRRLDTSGMPASWFKEDIILNQIDPGSKWNIYRLPSNGGGDPVPVVHGPSIEIRGVVSPDGHALAYLSDESGNLDVFIQSYPAAGAKEQISTGGAQYLWWTRDSRQLLFLKRDNSLWRATIEVKAGVATRAGALEQLGTLPAALIGLDMDPAGSRFLTLVPEHASVTSLTIEQGWLAAIQAKHTAK